MEAGDGGRLPGLPIFPARVSHRRVSSPPVYYPSRRPDDRLLPRRVGGSEGDIVRRSPGPDSGIASLSAGSGRFLGTGASGGPAPAPGGRSRARRRPLQGAEWPQRPCASSPPEPPASRRGRERAGPTVDRAAIRKRTLVPPTRNDAPQEHAAERRPGNRLRELPPRG